MTDTKHGTAETANPYLPQMTKVVEVIEETPTIRTVVLEPRPPLLFRAGQFVQLTFPGLGEAPFTPSSSPYDTKRLEATILRTGRVTEALHRVKAGDVLGLRGPFGKGYPVEKLAGKEVLVVGGGVGLAPLRALILALFHDIDRIRRMLILYGAREPKELLYHRLHDDWRSRKNVQMLTTIDRPVPGWTGRTGVVTTLFNDLDVNVPDTLVFSCGPEVMLKFVTLGLLEKGFKPEQIYLSMNRRMSCGVGKCGRCNIGPYYLCKDGPDMNYAEIMDYPNVF
jgi:NAD(P)H-flavin reductase